MGLDLVEKAKEYNLPIINVVVKEQTTLTTKSKKLYVH